MPATARRSKSEAYEKGVREGKAMAARSRSMEPEEEEEEEGEEEEMDMAMQPDHSRKRSAKGAKHTKPATDGYGMKKPMDAECGCSGKKGGKCDGNCGSMRKRSDSLTPLEYLAACDLGIQDRSTAYIRARLDMAETRSDLKCGKGSISEGEKCHVGTAQKVQPTPQSQVKRSRNKAVKTVLLAAAVGAGIGAVQGGLSARKSRKEYAQGALSKIKRLKAKGNDTLLAALRSAKHSQAMGMNDPRTQARQYANIMQAKTTRGLARRAAREGLAELKAIVPKSPARRRAARRGRRDSIWAEGFDS